MSAGNGMFHAKDAYQSEEFQAFCKKFNIPWDLKTKSMSVHFPQDGLLTVNQEYLAANPVDKLETTSLHNKEWRTFIPPPVEGQSSDGGL